MDVSKKLAILVAMKLASAHPGKCGHQHVRKQTRVGVLLCSVIICLNTQVLRAELRALEAKHDFGLVSPDSDLEKSFTLTNTSSHPIILLKGETSCSCTVAPLKVKRLGANASVALSVKMHASNQAKKMRNDVAVSWLYEGATATNTLFVTLLATVVQMANLDPSDQCDFGSLRRSELPQTKSIRITKNGDWRWDKVITVNTNRAFSAKLNPVLDGAYDLSITVGSEAGVGEYRLNGCVLQFVKNGVVSPLQMALPVHFTIIPDYITQPASILITAAASDKRPDAMVTIIRKGGGDFAINQIHIKGEILEVRDASTPLASHNGKICVAFKARAGKRRGTQIGQIVFDVESAKSIEQISVPFVVFGG